MEATVPDQSIFAACLAGTFLHKGNLNANFVKNANGSPGAALKRFLTTDSSSVRAGNTGIPAASATARLWCSASFNTFYFTCSCKSREVQRSLG